MGIEVLQEDGYVNVKQENYALQILKAAGMQECNATQCLIYLGIKLSKAEDNPKVEATHYKKLVGCLCYILHTCPDLAYLVG